MCAAAGLSLLTVPLFGHLSDKIGRKRMYMTGAALTALWAIPYFLLLDTKSPTLVFLAIFLSLIPHDMQYGPQAALIAETFTTKLRYSGAGLGLPDPARRAVEREFEAVAEEPEAVVSSRRFSRDRVVEPVR